MPSSNFSLALDDETELILDKIPYNLKSKHIRECMKSFDQKNILPDPVIIARNLDNGNLDRNELDLWIKRILKQIEMRK